MLLTRVNAHLAFILFHTSQGLVQALISKDDLLQVSLFFFFSFSSFEGVTQKRAHV